MRNVRFRDGGEVRCGEYDGEGTIHAAGRGYGFGDVEILSPCEPAKIVGFGGNHRTQGDNRDVFDEPESPGDLMSYVKPGHVTVGHGEEIALPDDDTVYELELAVVIDEECHDVAGGDYSEYVRGYTIYNDLTRMGPERLAWKKLFDDSAPLGPAVVPEGRIPEDAELRSRINGELEQTGKVSDYVFSASDLIAYVSDRITLYPGDVIAMGATHGYGRLTDGDSVELSIDGIGTLSNDVTVPAP
jgi:2-keto-4-pentenoate hydratase/2-oxohepta-3-ene-1,7-dioic acid hydratase in catechol pathway